MGAGNASARATVERMARAEGKRQTIGVSEGMRIMGRIGDGGVAHAVACRRRRLDVNQISTIATEAFAGLTALTLLYVRRGAVGWARLLLCS